MLNFLLPLRDGMRDAYVLSFRGWLFGYPKRVHDWWTDPLCPPPTWRDYLAGLWFSLLPSSLIRGG